MHQLAPKQHNILVKKGKLPIGVQFLISLVLLALGAFCLMYIIREHNYYASGNDAWGHLLKSDLMYQNIREGNYYPLLTKLWYNGIQPYRYWAPLPYYILAALQYLSGGNLMSSYYLFAGLSFFVGGFGWLLWGLSTRRMALCTFLSLIWFFFPENTRVYFCEGNIPRMVTAFLIPYLVYFIWLFVQKDRKWAAFLISIFTALIALSHLMISAMMGVAAFIFLVFFAVSNKKYLRSVQAIISMLLGYLMIGIWLMPALVGGLVSMDADASASVMKSLTYPLWNSLNPMNRIDGITDTFYYGIAVILISLFGIFLAKKNGKAGYFTNIIILLCTAPAFIPLLSKLPMNQLLWMMRFATIGYAFFLWSLIEWRSARRYFTVILCFILLVDCLPSLLFSRYYTQTRGNFVSELETAKRITNQRMALMDLSYLGSYPSFEICEGDNPTQYTYGWAWQGASTAANIVALNSALENGNFDFLFDRCIDLGDDTVVILKQLTKKVHEKENQLCYAAEESGYFLYSETNEAYIFHRNTPQNFAVKTQYQGIGIGKYADQIIYPYPAFTVGESDNIEDYSYDELSKYDTVYLSGFEYHNRKNAEELVTKLANNGIRVVIDMSHIPVVKENKRMYFLGVTAQDIEFTSTYPALNYQGKEIDTNAFPVDYAEWHTKYVEGVSEVLGTADYHGQKLTFAGTNGNKNIFFLGFNLPFYCTQTDDQNGYQILNDCFNTELYKLPVRTLVPITVEYSRNRIIIDTPVADINTTIAYQDIFKSGDRIVDKDNLLYVSKKHTEIQLVYPYLKQGIIASVLGFGGSILWILLIIMIDIIRRKKEMQGE